MSRQRESSFDAIAATRRLLAGWTMAVLIFLHLPIVLLVIYSFNASRLNIRWGGFTLNWYRDLLSNQQLIVPLEHSIVIALITTAISVPLGISAAWSLHRYRLLRRTTNTLAMIPIVIPDVIMGISLLLLFATVSQFANRAFARIGFSDDWFGLGFATVIIAHITFCFPFVMVAIRARLAGLDPSLEEAAMDLGATPLVALWQVIVPYLMPAIVAGALMAFTLSMDELIVTYFTCSGESITLPVKAFGMARVGMNPSLNAISAVLIVITATLMSVADFIRRRFGSERST